MCSTHPLMQRTDPSAWQAANKCCRPKRRFWPRATRGEKEVGEDESARQEGPKRKLLGILKAGEYFGERALLTEEPRSATVAAVSKVEVLRIDRAAFLSLLGPLHDKLSRHMPKDNHRRSSAAGMPGGLPADYNSNLSSKQVQRRRSSLTAWPPSKHGGGLES